MSQQWGAELGARADVPEPHRLVGAARSERLSIRAEREASDEAQIAGERTDEVVGGGRDVPQSDSVVLPA